MAQAAAEQNNLAQDSIQALAEEISIIDVLSSQQKAAALLVALGKQAAMNLIKYFDSSDLRTLSSSARTLPDIKIQDLDRIVHQFEDAFTQGASFSHAGERFTSLLQETLPEDEAAAVLDPLSAPALAQECVIEIMKRMQPEDLQLHFANEHPQVISYIMARLPDTMTAKILLLQSPEMRADIIQRTLYSKPVQPIIAEILNQGLRPVLTADSNGNEQQSHYKQIAMILNQLDKTELDEVMASLAKLKAEDLSNIKARMFVFEDIIQLTDHARLLLFNDIAADMVIRALRGAEKDLTDCILAALSQRTRRMVETELGTPDEQILPVEIQQARRDIAGVALKLAEEGVITLMAEEPAA